MSFKIGMELTGEVSGVQPYGAFVSIEDGTQGLVHISEVKHGYIKNISDVLAVGQKVQVEIIDIDEYSSKISLSMRSLDKKAPIPLYRRKKYFTNKKKQIGFESLANQMSNWVMQTLDDLVQK